jgi:hypothetical protein
MATSQEIVTQLQAVLPTITTLFNDSISITSLTNSSDLVTATTAAAHGLTTGKAVVISGAIAPVPIATLTSDGTLASANTYPYDHDLTENYQTTVNISGADQSGYNGDFELLTVPNRYEFTFRLTSDPVSPATGDILLFDGKERGYNGVKQVTVTSATTFTYPITGVVYSPALGTIVCAVRARITKAITIEKILDSYTKQPFNDLYAFVVLGNTTPSKDRNVLSDSTYKFIEGQAFRQEIIQNFSVYVIGPATTEISGANIRDLMESVRVYLFKAVMRVHFPSGLSDNSNFVVWFDGDDFEGYFNAYYIHKFNFAINYFIEFADTVEPAYNVAFRDTHLIIDNSPLELVTAEINLDDEPYES